MAPSRRRRSRNHLRLRKAPARAPTRPAPRARRARLGSPSARTKSASLRALRTVSQRPVGSVAERPDLRWVRPPIGGPLLPQLEALGDPAAQAEGATSAAAHGERATLRRDRRP